MSYDVITRADIRPSPANMAEQEFHEVENLTPEQMEYAYRIQKLRFLMDDAAYWVEVFADFHEGYDDLLEEFDDTDLLELAKRFTDTEDNDISPSEQWEALIVDYLNLKLDGEPAFVELIDFVRTAESFTCRMFWTQFREMWMSYCQQRGIDDMDTDIALNRARTVWKEAQTSTAKNGDSFDVSLGDFFVYMAHGITL